MDIDESAPQDPSQSPIPKKHKQSEVALTNDLPSPTSIDGSMDSFAPCKSSTSDSLNSNDMLVHNENLGDDHDDDDNEADTVDNYDRLQAQFDNVDLPPGVEVSVSFLNDPAPSAKSPASTSSLTSSKAQSRAADAGPVASSSADPVGSSADGKEHKSGAEGATPIFPHSPTAHVGNLASPQQQLSHGTLVNVLSRLPAQSIVRFRCVCKSWLALLSNPDFIKRHLKISTAGPVDLDRTKVVCCHLYSDFFTCSLHSFLYQPSVHAAKLVRPFTGAEAHVIGSCNGLVCVRILVSSEVFIILWNPCTGVYHQLPGSHGLRLDEDLVYGFGFDHSTDDHKVVAVCRYNLRRGPTDLVQRAAVFSLKANSWRRVPCVESLFYSSNPGSLVGGALNWAVKSRVPADFTKFSIGVASFDLASEKFRTVGLSNMIDVGLEMAPTIGVLDGCLCLLTYDKVASAHDVWVMNQFGVESSWTHVGSISYPPNRHRHLRPTLLFRFKDAVIINTGDFPNKVGIFDLKEETHRFPMMHSTSYCHGCHAGVIYRETLVSPYPDGDGDGGGGGVSVSVSDGDGDGGGGGVSDGGGGVSDGDGDGDGGVSDGDGVGGGGGGAVVSPDHGYKTAKRKSILASLSLTCFHA